MVRSDPAEEKARLAVWQAHADRRDAAIATIEAAADPGFPTRDYAVLRQRERERDEAVQRAETHYRRLLDAHYVAHPEHSVDPERARKIVGG